MKGALEAYPENISYSTVIEKMVDYNNIWRGPFIAGAEWADQHPRKGLVDIEKACEWIKQNISRYLFNTGKLDEYIPTCSNKLYEDLKKAMEE